MMTTRSETAKASVWVWVTCTKATPKSVLRRLSSRCMRKRRLASSEPSGSSSRSTSGRVTSARARPTRCCWPPESCWIGRSARSSISTARRISSARRLRSSDGTLRMRRPNSTFCATDICGNSAKCWNTMAVLRSCGSRCVQSRPAMSICPSVGSSKPDIMRSVVVLPHPDGPMREMYSPCAICRDRSSTARISRPKRLVTLIRSTAMSLMPNPANPSLPSRCATLPRQPPHKPLLSLHPAAYG